ncbi:MAG: SpoIIE family protein phosphatase, partial [Flavobacteriales bacterium]
YEEDEDGVFTTVNIKLPQNSKLYMFSDGYADQFGGPKGKKFRYKSFKNLFCEIHEKDMEEQRAILDKKFEEWRNESDQEQVDDVCVVGVNV